VTQNPVSLGPFTGQLDGDGARCGVGTHRRCFQGLGKGSADYRNELGDMRANLLDGGNGSEPDLGDLEPVLLDPSTSRLESLPHLGARSLETLFDLTTSSLEPLPDPVACSLETLPDPVSSSLEPLLNPATHSLEAFLDSASKVAESVSNFVEESRVEGDHFVCFVRSHRLERTGQLCDARSEEEDSH